MEKDRLSRKLAVILHADVVGSTKLVQQNETLAHERIQDAFKRFSGNIEKYQGHVLELRGDALLAEFERPSDAVAATLSFQTDHTYYISRLKDDLQPTIRVGIAMGEVVIADGTVTGAGVVLAQRVEQLADPGGLFVTAALHEALPKGMPFDLEDMGEQEVKGFDDPVRVYRVELSANHSLPSPHQKLKNEASPKKPRLMIATIVIALVVAGGAAYWFKTQEPKVEAASIDRMAYPLPDKPSIAVLPFDNMSDLAEQEYFVDGMTEDLITDISKISGLFVIARNSVFTYKGKPVKVRQVAEELGVRYVLEGSVQRAGNHVRINAQLIDATTGGHVWAERYDGVLDDVFTMRDQITRNIVTALAVALVSPAQGNQGHAETNNPEAYDAYLRGWAHYRKYTPANLVKAIADLENAIELDPDYTRARAALAAAYWGVWSWGWAESTGVSYDEAWKMMNRHLEAAMKNPTPLAHRIRAKQFQYDKRWNEAYSEAERAIALDPNDPQGYRAMSDLLVNLGRTAEGLEFIKKAIRLDPQSDYFDALGWAQFHLERYDEAAANFLRFSKLYPEDQWNHLWLAAAYGHLGREQDAISAFATFNELNVKHDPILWKDLPWTLARLSNWTIKDEAGLERLRAGLRVAGVPEGETGRLVDLKFTDLVTVLAGTFDVEGAIEIDAAEAKTLHDHGIAFFDSRGKGHYGRGHIPGATNLYFHQVRESLADLVEQNAEVVFYCGDPKCHLAANSSAQALILGYTRVYYFAGGFSAWEVAGYPVEGS